MAESRNFHVEPAIQRPWRRMILVGLLMLVAVGVLSGGGYWWWLNTPPAMPQTADQAKSLLTSARFRQLSPERQEDYLERIRELLRDVPADERRALMRDLFRDEQTRETMFETMREQMVMRARRFAVADEAEQKLMINQMIVQMQAMRAMFGGGRRGGDDANETRPEPTAEEQAEREQRRAERRQEMNRRVEQEAATGNPQDTELVVSMMRAVRQEMQRRGTNQRGGGGQRSQ